MADDAPFKRAMKKYEPVNPRTALLLCNRRSRRQFRVDTRAQARSLLEFDRAPISLGLYPLLRDHYRRVIFAGTGP
ncbi:hypothetical protein [Mycobacterium tilburgii]|uniref:hypothetical protein n=1 Tax=Mycobacterium tilburgii TaxID=44467 RepID=UPI0016423568|nr:hypothetical protein [Mycobacterium tilburgii]